MPETPNKPNALVEHEPAPSLLSRAGEAALNGVLGVLGLFAAWLFSCLPLLAAVGFSSGYLGFVVLFFMLVLAIEDLFDLDLAGKHRLYRRVEDRPERLLVDENGEKYIGEHEVGALVHDLRYGPWVPKRRRALWIARIRLLLPALVLGVSDFLVWSAGNTIFAQGWTPDPLKVTFGILWFIWFGFELMSFGGKRTRATQGLVAQQLLAASGEARQGDLMLAQEQRAGVGAISSIDEHQTEVGALSLHDDRD